MNLIQSNIRQHRSVLQKHATPLRKITLQRRAHLEDEAEHNAHAGVDAEGAQGGEGGIGANHEGEKVRQGGEGDGGAGVGERRRHALSEHDIRTFKLVSSTKHTRSQPV